MLRAYPYKDQLTTAPVAVCHVICRSRHDNININININKSQGGRIGRQIETLVLSQSALPKGYSRIWFRHLSSDLTAASAAINMDPR
ncbi:hypothetical protein MY4038_002941 [Beauveria bassiana]